MEHPCHQVIIVAQLDEEAKLQPKVAIEREKMILKKEKKQIICSPDGSSPSFYYSRWQ